jgi:hypothetical protein
MIFTRFRVDGKVNSKAKLGCQIKAFTQRIGKT